MYSICAPSSYGWICAFHFCVVVGTRLTAETLPLETTFHFCFSFVWPPCHACGYFSFMRTMKDCATLWRKRDKKKEKNGMTGTLPNACNGDEVSSLVVQPPTESVFVSACASLIVRLMDGKRSDVVAIVLVFFHIISFCQSDLSACAYVSDLKN